jgi:hypothetical protein
VLEIFITDKYIYIKLSITIKNLNAVEEVNNSFSVFFYLFEQSNQNTLVVSIMYYKTFHKKSNDRERAY